MRVAIVASLLVLGFVNAAGVAAASSHCDGPELPVVGCVLPRCPPNCITKFLRHAVGPLVVSVLVLSVILGSGLGGS